MRKNAKKCESVVSILETNAFLSVWNFQKNASEICANQKKKKSWKNVCQYWTLNGQNVDGKNIKFIKLYLSGKYG